MEKLSCLCLIEVGVVPSSSTISNGMEDEVCECNTFNCILYMLHVFRITCISIASFHFIPFVSLHIIIQIVESSFIYVNKKDSWDSGKPRPQTNTFFVTFRWS